MNHYLHNGKYAKSSCFVQCMKKMKDKVKKKRINWREILFHMHNKYLSDRYTLKLGDHPKMSHNRLAYYVLKKYCTTATLRFLRSLYEKSTMTEQEVVEWYRFYVRKELDYGQM